MAELENVVVEATPKKPQRNYKKELEEALTKVDTLVEENNKLQKYNDVIFQQSQELSNKLLVATNALKQAQDALSIMGTSYNMALNQLNSVMKYLEKEVK